MSKTKEQVYREQLQALGIYHEILEPEIKALARVEREYTRAQKAWSASASPPGSAPSFLDPHYAIVQKLRAEGLQHREALMNMAKTLAKIAGTAGGAGPDQDDLLTQKLDAIAERVSGYDLAPGSDISSAGIWIQGEDGMERVGSIDPNLLADPFAGIPAADEAAAISDMMDRQEEAEDINERLAKGVGPGPRGAICPAADGPWYAEDYDLAAAVAEDMG